MIVHDKVLSARPRVARACRAGARRFGRGRRRVERVELRSQAPLCTGSWRENCLVARIGEKQIIDAAIREARRQWRPIRR